MFNVLLRMLVRADQRSKFDVFERSINMPAPSVGLEIYLSATKSGLSLKIGENGSDRLIWDVPTQRFVFERTYSYYPGESRRWLLAHDFKLVES